MGQEASPGSSSGQPTPAGIPFLASAMRLEIDKSACQGNHVLTDYLLKKFLNDMQNKKMHAEVHTERVHKTMAMLEERYRNSDKKPIHFQILKVQRYLALKYYGLQSVVETLIKGDKQPDESERYLSDIDHAKFHTMTETHIRTAAVTQAERMLRDQVRAANKRNNAQTTTPAEANTTNANNDIKQTMVQTTTILQGDSKCPKKKEQAKERAKKDVQIARLSIASGKVEDITEGDEH
ncbi:hypothetical protein SARC_09766 [Sphaeroforma arctica JP610]|uniref:Uncharacterized protein n=1 Tax=Sphaeroforma arctica JP610 TaxID=667725 RepID=A0A0L0FM05_9EUKA|nr:hypothetical protein SARC_09766 [Sphaeroforma arctica JP610]KNC77785.1 hypothetical protein SARC_09766 [Sphaeroforma arctica JP610]|eukprot:XP_014151687.1 hypothetical protein SARC_09766 [Sphaeroforma arctica JP610]